LFENLQSQNKNTKVYTPCRIMLTMAQIDLTVAKRVESAWKEIEEGKYKKMSSRDFLKEIRSLK